MTPWFEGPCLLIHAVLARQFRDKVAGNMFTNLFQCAKLRAGRFHTHVLLLAAVPRWFSKENIAHQSTLFRNSYGMTVISFFIVDALLAQSRLALDGADFESASAHVATALEVAHALRTIPNYETLDWSQALVSRIIRHLHTQPPAEFWSDENYRQLSTSLLRWMTSDKENLTFNWERSRAYRIYDGVLQNSYSDARMLLGLDSWAELWGTLHRETHFLHSHDILAMLEDSERYASLSDYPAPEAIQWLVQEELNYNTLPFRPVSLKYSQHMYNGMHKTHYQAPWVRASISLLVCGVALDRHYEECGSISTSLKGVVQPEFHAFTMDALCVGELKLKITKSGYCLYSVGADGDDNGGDEATYGLTPFSAEQDHILRRGAFHPWFGEDICWERSYSELQH